MKIQIGNKMDDFNNIPINHQLQFTTTDAAVVIPTNPQKDMGNKIIGIVYGNNSGTIIFENELTRIPDSFLLGCTNLRSISLPPSVRSIGSHAFFMCQNLERVKLNEGLKVIKIQAFADTAIKKVTIPSSCLLLDTSCLQAQSLKHVKLIKPEGYRYIGDFAFGKIVKVSGVSEADDFSITTFG